MTPLCQQFPDDRQHRFRLATSRSYLARSLSDLGRLPDAEAEFRVAIEPLHALVAADGNHLDYLLELGRAKNNLGHMLSGMQRLPEAIAVNREAIQLHSRAPEKPDHGTGLVMAYGNLSVYLQTPAEKEKVSREAVAVADPLRKQFPNDLQVHRRYLMSHQNLAFALLGLNKHIEAEAECRLVRDGRLELANRYPSVRAHRQDLAESHNNLAVTLTRLNRQRGAAVEDTAAVALFQRLPAEEPTNRKNRWLCILCLDRLGNYQASLGTAATLGEAEAHYRAKLKLIDDLLAKEPKDREYRGYSIETRGSLGRTLNRVGQFSDAVAEFRTALAQLETLMAELPQDRSLLGLRAQNRFNLGLALGNLGQQAESLAAYRSSLAD